MVSSQVHVSFGFQVALQPQLIQNPNLEKSDLNESGTACSHFRLKDEMSTSYERLTACKAGHCRFRTQQPQFEAITINRHTVTLLKTALRAHNPALARAIQHFINTHTHPELVRDQLSLQLSKTDDLPTGITAENCWHQLHELTKL